MPQRAAGLLSVENQAKAITIIALAFDEQNRAAPAAKQLFPDRKTIIPRVVRGALGTFELCPGLLVLRIRHNSP